jgi:hypothetical protein
LGLSPRKESRTKEEKEGKFTGAGSIESRPRMKKLRTGRFKREVGGARKEQELRKSQRKEGGGICGIPPWEEKT